MSENLKTFVRMVEKVMDLLFMAMLAGMQISIAVVTVFMTVKFVGVYSELAGVLVLFFVLITQSVMKAQFDKEFSILEAQFPLFLVWVVAQMTGEQSSLFLLSKLIPLSIGMSFAMYLSTLIFKTILKVFDFKETHEDMPKAKNQPVATRLERLEPSVEFVADSDDYRSPLFTGYRTK